MNFCPKCGFPTEKMKFCPKCGFNLQTPEETKVEKVVFEPEKMDEETVGRGSISKDTITNVHGSEDRVRELRSALVGDKAYHYVPIFEDLDKNGGQSWNWCGCLFAPMWFAYRRLYGWSVIAIFVPGIIAFFVGLLMATASAGDGAINIVSRCFGIACAIAFGIISNSAYKKRIDKLVAEMPSDAEGKDKFIKSNGGVSAIGLGVALVVYFGFYILSVYLSV